MLICPSLSSGDTGDKSSGDAFASGFEHVVSLGLPQHRMLPHPIRSPGAPRVVPIRQAPSTTFASRPRHLPLLVAAAVKSGEARLALANCSSLPDFARTIHRHRRAVTPDVALSVGLRRLSRLLAHQQTQQKGQQRQQQLQPTASTAAVAQQLIRLASQGATQGASPRSLAQGACALSRLGSQGIANTRPTLQVRVCVEGGGIFVCLVACLPCRLPLHLPCPFLPPPCCVRPTTSMPLLPSPREGPPSPTAPPPPPPPPHVTLPFLRRRCAALSARSSLQSAARVSWQTCWWRWMCSWWGQAGWRAWRRQPRRRSLAGWKRRRCRGTQDGGGELQAGTCRAMRRRAQKWAHECAPAPPPPPPVKLGK